MMNMNEFFDVEIECDGETFNCHQVILSISSPYFRAMFRTDVLDNVLLEHVGLPCVLPFAVHLDLGHFPDTQGYLGLLSEPCTPT